jgi:hypothetical protein
MERIQSTTTLSLSQSFTKVLKDDLRSRTIFILMFFDSSQKEWCPYGSYETRIIAECFEKQAIKTGHGKTAIIPCEHYGVLL